MIMAFQSPVWSSRGICLVTLLSTSVKSYLHLSHVFLLLLLQED